MKSINSKPFSLTVLDRSYSVQTKVLFHVVPLVLISTLIVFSLFEWNARKTAAKQLSVKLEKMVAVQSGVIAGALWNLADDQIHLILEALLADPDVVAAAVIDDNETPIAKIGNISAFQLNDYTAIHTIHYNSDGDLINIGQLRLALSNRRLHALTRERMVLAGVLAGILLITTIGATLIANRRIVGKPIALLLDSINQAQDEGSRRVVEWRSSDEVGRVVTAFNTMQQSQVAYEDRLRAANDKLELRVDERTASLVGAQSEALQARKQLTDAIDSISEGFALFDKNDVLVVANRRYSEIMLGNSNASWLRGKTFAEVAGLAARTKRFPASVSNPDLWISRQISRHSSITEPFVQEVKGDHWLQVSNRRTEEGGTVAVQSDITEIKRISDELNRSKETAEAANEAKSAFLATMSHEIRTPLNGIVGMSTLLDGTELNAEQKDFSQTIAMAADTLLTIINDILDFSKVEAGALELERTAIDLVETIENSVELVASKAADKGIELACQIDVSVPSGVIGDSVRLKQIMMNLLNNAIKFTEKGEVVLTVTSMFDNNPATPGDSTLLRFEVADTGIGIPSDRMDRLFKSFSQVDASTSRRYGGTGLGLAISKRLVELMGGEIKVESDVGVGTKFSFELPAEISVVPDRQAREQQVSRLKGSRVLIVDDNRTNRLILSEKLRGWEIEAEALESPVQALEQIRSDDGYSAYIIDYKMPEMNGLDLARKIKALKGSQSPPMILFTSICMVEDHFREDVEEIGLSSVLTKPSRSGQLLSALVDAIAPIKNEKNEHSNSGNQLNEASSEMPRLNILLVDDNPLNRKVGAKILDRLGYKAVVVSSGSEAIERSTIDDFDVILMDIEMPEMDGISTTAIIRKKITYEKVPYIVALTANAMSSEKEHYLKSGMDDYLSKPINISALVESLGNAVKFRMDQRERKLLLTTSAKGVRGA